MTSLHHRIDLPGNPVFCQVCGKPFALGSNEEPTLLKTVMLGSATEELLPSDELDNLFAEGMALLAQGKTEEAVPYLQRVLDHDHTYDSGRLAPYVIELQRKRARQSHQASKWQQEVAAWKALLRLDPEDEQALEYLPIAEVNLRRAPMYERARRFTNASDLAAARNLLKELWRTVPYYGDPAGLAKKVGMRVPLPLTGPRKLKWRVLIVGFWLLVVLSIMLFFMSFFSVLRAIPLLSVSTVFYCLIMIVAVIGTILLRNHIDRLREKWFLTA